MRVMIVNDVTMLLTDDGSWEGHTLLASVLNQATEELVAREEYNKGDGDMGDWLMERLAKRIGGTIISKGSDVEPDKDNVQI